MADVRDQASCSSSCYYDIFLSFRGEDTRKSFTDHLYTALIRQGFITFRDDDEAEKGENLKSELEKAIRQSKSSILVLSKDYASSPWCLDELVMILDKKRNSELIRLHDPKHWKHEVLPVFYDVKPSHLRRQTGTIAESFVGYEKQIEEETDPHKKTNLIEKVKRWRSALTEVADLIGLESQNHDSGHEAKFVQKIVNVIRDKLRKKALDVSPYKVGIESRAKKINMWVQDASSDVTIRAICGMGGIGKTTIAKFVYNENYNSFEGSSFLANISEVSQQPNGLLCLQRQLLSDISRKKHGKINNVDEGIAQIQNLLCGKRVLLVLDDVEEKDQIYMVLGMQDWLFPESKIIITTRHERLLKPHQICRVEKFGEEESIKLFSLHAFGNDHPMESYIEHTKRVVRICEGLPLALKVIGSSLSGKTEDEWVCELERLEAIPHRDIRTKLKTSFDSLQDDYDKRLFLHIACFFVGTHEDYVIKILEKCNLQAKIGVQNLIDRCLLERYSRHRVLKMHRLIQDMGRDIIRQESHEPGERSRLWHPQDVFNVLKNETGTEAVEGLAIDMRQVDETRNNAKKLQYEEFFDKSIFSNYFNSLKRRLPGQNDVYLRTDALKSMTRLKLLELNYVKLKGNYDNFPKGLLWLSWHGFPLDSVPCELALKNLVILDLRHSRLKQVWKKTPFLESLKILDMSYSERLERTPNFVGLHNLERLILRGCVSLVEVGESIGILEMLELLDLSDCKTLQKLPRNIQKLESLKTINMSGCNISGFTSEMRDMKSLDMVRYFWSMVSTPRKGPQTLWASLPFSLRELNLSGCNLSDDSFPHNFGNMPSLNNVNLSNNPFRRLPNCIKSLTGLSTLDIHSCNRLQSLDLKGLQFKLYDFFISHCISLKKITSLDYVRDSHILDCYDLDEVEGYFKRSPRKLFGLDIINNSLPDSSDQIVKLEFGITNLITKSGEFSSASSYEKSEGSSISFTVPLLVTHSIIQCLNVFCTCEIKDDDVAAIEEFDIFSTFFLGKVIYVKIKNKTKDLTWIYIPVYGRPNHNKDGWEWWSRCGNQLDHDKDIWEWGSRWRFGNQLEGGDEITITFNTTSICEVKECGYKIEYQEEEENGEGSTTIHKSHHHFPQFRLTTGEYLLCQTFKNKPDEDYWFPKHSKHLF